MSNGTAGPGASPLTEDEAKPFRRLSGSLWATGVVSFVCGACVFLLALTGYATPEKINWELVLPATVLFVVGGGLVKAGRSLRQFAAGGDRSALVAAVGKMAALHGLLLVAFCLGTAHVAVRTVGFLAKIAGVKPE